MSIFSLNAADISNALSGASPLSILTSIVRPSYSIKSSSGATAGLDALEFDSMMEVNPSGYASITKAPVEAGKYSSINKVRDPRRLRCSIVLSGMTGYSGGIPNINNFTSATQSSLLSSIQLMIATAGTYDIETPKEILQSFDLIGHSYTVNSRMGITLLTVHLEFEEVMQQMIVALSNSQATNKPTQNSISASVTGVCTVALDGGATTSTLDQLKTAWAKLQSATGTLSSTLTSTVTQTFTSAATTVSQTAEELAASAVSKSADIVSDITDLIT